MRLRSLVVSLIVCVFIIISWVIAPSALALTQIRLFDISYEPCSAEVGEGAVTSGGSPMAANCFIVSGKAENATNKFFLYPLCFTFQIIQNLFDN